MRRFITRITILSAAILCLCNATYATEPVFTIDNKSVCENATAEQVNITLGDFTDMISFQFTVGWNPNVMQISQVLNVNPAISSDIFFGMFNSESDVLTVSWFDNSLNGVTLADDEVLFTVEYNMVGNNSMATMVTFLDDPTIREVSSLENGAITLVQGTWNEGMTMIAQPEITNSVIADDVNMSGAGGVDITITNGTAPYFYAWDNGATTEDLVNVPMGTYNCVVTDNKGCATNLGPFSVGNIVGTKDIEGLVNVQVSPNPTAGNLNLKVQLENAQNLEVNIFNILGEKVYFEQTESANIELDLDLSNLANGNYIVQLRSNDGMHVEKIQLHR